MAVDFYKRLKPLRLPIAEVFHRSHFVDIPDDWHIIIADVKNSTAAVNEGRHNDVNLIAATSLIIALNVAKEKDIEIPFFFSGDGGTMIVPEEILNEVLTRIEIHNSNSVRNFSLELHVGSIAIKKIRDKGHFVQLVKTQVGKAFSKAILVGDGLRYAEVEIKQSAKEKTDKTESELNLSGLECRWDKISPPTKENEIVCYLIEAVDPNKQIEVYRKVMTKVDEIYGSIEARNPISLEQLKLLLDFNKIKKEMLVRYGKWKSNYLTTTFLKTFIGRIYFKFNLKINNLRGREYLNQLILNADTFIVDGRINTIITGTREKRKELLEYLSVLEETGELIYGHHISNESIMTCYIENRNQKHIHFIDGSDGGYTEAAKELKRKLHKSPG